MKPSIRSSSITHLSSPTNSLSKTKEAKLFPHYSSKRHLLILALFMPMGLALTNYKYSPLPITSRIYPSISALLIFLAVEEAKEIIPPTDFKNKMI